MHSIAAASWGFDRIDIFWLDPQFAMNHKSWDGTDWVIGWDDLGGTFTSAPAAASPGPNQLDVFGLGPDYAMYHKAWNGTAWSPQWESLGGSFLSAPAAIMRNEGQPPLFKIMDVFAVGDDHQMYHLIGSIDVWRPGPVWSGWERLGGDFTSAATVISPSPGRLEVFGRDRDLTLRHKTWTGTGWSLGWDNLGGVLASPPQAIALGPDRWDVFAIGTDRALWHTWWNGIFWNEWESLGGEFASAPSLASSGPNRLDVLATGSDGTLYYRSWDSLVWSDWEALGGPFSSASTVVAPQASRLELVVPVEILPSQPHDVVERRYNIARKSWAGSVWLPVGIELLAVHMRVPSRYWFSIDYMDPQTTRSLVSDDDYLSSSIRPGGWPADTQTRFFPNVSGPPYLVNMNFEPITVEPCETVVFNYLIINKGHADRDTIDKLVAGVGNALASAGVDALTGSSLLGGLAGKALELFIGGIVFADCDGLVAIEQVTFTGKELQALTTDTQPHTVTTSYPGTDSNTGCGDNSFYVITWSVKSVH